MTSWSTVTVTGYNASPPPDDGSQIASNKVTWAGQKTQLTDPLKTAIDSLNTSGAALGSIVDGLNSSNALVNGGFEVWNRGAGGAASFTIAGTDIWTADRWWAQMFTASNRTVSQVTGLADASQWALRMQRSNATSATTALTILQPLTLDQIIPLRGSVCTLSMTLQAGADYSPTSMHFHVHIYCGTGAAAIRPSGGNYTSETEFLSVPSITTSATRYSLVTSAVIPTSTTQMCVYLQMNPTGTAGAADYVTIDDVRLGTGGGTVFDRRTFAQEQRECERFYVKTFPYATAPAQSGGVTGALTVLSGTGVTNTEGLTWQFPTRMYKTPVITTYNPSAANANWRDVTSSADRAVTVGTVADTSVPISLAAGVAATTNQIHAQADAELT